MNKTRFCKIRNLFEVILLMCLSLHIRGAQAQTARFTIHLEKVPMEQVVNEIEKQSRYLFLFNKDIDSRRIIVSVHAYRFTPKIKPLHKFFPCFSKIRNLITRSKACRFL